jgi:hypothetical protein
MERRWMAGGEKKPPSLGPEMTARLCGGSWWWIKIGLQKSID